MFEMIHATDPCITALYGLFPAGQPGMADNLLRILVHQSPESPVPDCYFKGDATAQYYRGDLDDGICVDVRKWTAALESALSRDFRLLRQVSPALGAVCEREDPDQVRTLLARTLRMFLLGEALLLPQNCSPDNPYQAEIGNLPPQVSAAVEAVRNATHPLDQGWHVSLPLALLVALGESQCEYFQCFTWEAYSAGRARDEFLRLWPRHPAVEAAINAIAVLIRSQSAVGQAVRLTGSPAFIERFACGNEPSWIAFTAEERVAALRLMAIIEEARNHCLPSPAADPLNAGVEVPWDRVYFVDWATRYALFEREPRATTPIYSYMKAKYVGGDGSLDPRIEALKEAIWAATGRNCADHPNVSFGQEQVGPQLRGLLRQVMVGFPLGNEADRIAYFRTHFRAVVLEIPDNYSANRPAPEKTLCILLQDPLVALRRLFPGGEAAPRDTALSVGTSPDDGSAAWLFQYLLDRSKAIMGCTLAPGYGHWPAKRKNGADWVEQGGRSSYVPLPLIGRISEIVYRLRRERCFSLPVSIDGHPPSWIHIPADVKKASGDGKTDELRLVVANFVLGIILNQAMAQGLDHADLDLKGLVARITSGPLAEDLMQPDDWTSAIQGLYRQGGFDTLLGRYMSNYNCRADILRFLGAPGSEGFAARAAGSPVAVGPPVFQAMDGYLTHHCDTPMILIGVDIGGTLTKMQLFIYRARRTGKNGRSKQGWIRPIGRAFRMETSDPDTHTEMDPSTTAAKALGKGTERFGDRLVRQIAKECRSKLSKLARLLHWDDPMPVVIGLTWPGPIRDGHIAGHSNPLRLLHWPRARQDGEYAIHDIFKVDIPGAVRNAWKKEFGPGAGFTDTPFVGLLNDGDGEAVGTIIAALSRQPAPQAGSHEEQRLAVIKLGTGLAGGFLRSAGNGFALQAGLFEWGKLLLDVGAPPRAGFPQGVAAEYLSQRCLPRLAKVRGKAQAAFQEDEPDSGEIGRIAEVGDALDKGNASRISGSYQDLVCECGARQAARSQPWRIPVNIELVRLLLAGQLRKEPDLLFALQIALRIFDLSELERQARMHVWEYGKTRLSKLVKWPWAGNSPCKLPNSGDSYLAKILSGNTALREAAATATDCIAALGAYLGDFCVLLHDQLGVNQVILAGGVLSGRTAEIAIAEARKRVGLYGLDLGEPAASGTCSLTKRLAAGVASTGSAIGAGKPSKSVDRGTLGAAAFAAAGFIQNQQATGLRRLTACLLPLGSATQVRVDQSKVLVAGVALQTDGEDLDFATYALSQQDLTNFMKESAADWGYYQSEDDTYVRWMVR